MKKNIFIIIALIILFSVNCYSQDKRGNVWIMSGSGMTATFTDTSKPTLNQLFPNMQKAFHKASSTICDSTSGKLILLCNGATLWDTLGNIIENGDSLIPPKQYGMNTPASGNTTQCSLILPKGSNGLYYVFITAVTDSMFDKWFLPNATATPADLFHYHVVDMNANGGQGKVIQKNIPLITNTELARVGMMACRHANGYDWWLLKQGLDTNIIYTFLVTKDTVELKLTQGFIIPKFDKSDFLGQSCFSSDGSKYAFATGGANSGKGAQLGIADFDRCTGLLSNMKSVNVPIDSTGYPIWDTTGRRDSTILGVCFSPNDSFLYINKYMHTYQYEYNNPDSNQAWYEVHRYDTIAEYSLFGQMQKGIDGRIYIGNFGGLSKQMSVVNNPDVKGVGCNFCPRCLRLDTLGNITAGTPPCMPNYGLGAQVCWALVNDELLMLNEELVVYPNPSSAIFYIKNADGKRRNCIVF
ncbi:MAG: hypothetical protein IPF62_14580 [Bacteroidetes bacterium]|nr:hypothetical protein [Bacteroidota bacterium]